jgi:hypothetical protein
MTSPERGFILCAERKNGNVIIRKKTQRKMINLDKLEPSKEYHKHQRFLPLIIVFPFTIVFLLSTVGLKSALAYAGIVAIALAVIFYSLKLRKAAEKVAQTNARLKREADEKKAKVHLAKHNAMRKDFRNVEREFWVRIMGLCIELPADGAS